MTKFFVGDSNHRAMTLILCTDPVKKIFPLILFLVQRVPLENVQVSLYSLHNSLCHPGVTRLYHFVRQKNLPFPL